MLFVVADAIRGLRFVGARIAFDAAIDDIDGRAKTSADIGGGICCIGFPRAIDHMQHGWLRWLWIDVEEYG